MVKAKRIKSGNTITQMIFNILKIRGKGIKFSILGYKS
jgi:hypothetical protein